MTPGEILRPILERLKWSETRLAIEADIDRSAIHKILDGDMGLGPERAGRIHEALARAGEDVSVSQLTGGPTEKELQKLFQQAEKLTAQLDEARERLLQAMGH